jgi:hypothetical protein
MTQHWLKYQHQIAERLPLCVAIKYELLRAMLPGIDRSRW